MTFFHLKTTDEFIKHPINRNALSDGHRLALMIYWVGSGEPYNPADDPNVPISSIRGY